MRTQFAPTAIFVDKFFLLCYIGDTGIYKKHSSVSININTPTAVGLVLGVIDDDFDF